MTQKQLRTIFLTCMALATVSGFIAELFHERALASRNSTGTYSLPAGNPVVTGTTISTSWANGTLGDLATETTNSLDRNGRGAMLAPLQLSNGTSAAPSMTFGADTASGWYRKGAGDFAFQANAIMMLEVNDAGIFAPYGLTAFQQNDGGNGVQGYGSGTGAGGNFVGGLSNGSGLLATGSGTGYGGYFTPGSTSTSGNRQAGVFLNGGDIIFGTTNPSSSTDGGPNILTPKNIVKAWVNFVGTGGTVNDGFNIKSVTCGSNVDTVTFAQNMANSNYAVTCVHNGGSAAASVATQSLGTSSFQVVAVTPSTGAVINACTSLNVNVSCIVLGAQ